MSLPQSLLWRRRAFFAALLVLLAPPAVAANRDKVKEEPVIPGVPQFFNIQPIVLPVIEGNAVTRQVGVLLTVELAEGHRKTEAAEKERELTDAFITELYRIYGWRSGADQVVNERLIKHRLQEAADHVLGKGVAHAILIRQLLEQPR